jgi:membrane protease YdiL (CAAX protease family)
LGIVRTTCLGFLLAASFLLSGSLWPAVLAHTILDVLGGLVLGETLVRE